MFSTRRATLPGGAVIQPDALRARDGDPGTQVVPLYLDCLPVIDDGRAGAAKMLPVTAQSVERSILIDGPGGAQ